MRKCGEIILTEHTEQAVGAAAGCPEFAKSPFFTGIWRIVEMGTFVLYDQPTAIPQLGDKIGIEFSARIGQSGLKRSTPSISR